MTREEAINELQNNKQDYTYIMTDDAIDMAIKALSTDSCEDCISREYILSKAHCCRDDLADDEPCCVDVDDIKEAPSIQPKQKTGHWIKSSNGMFAECSDCGKHGEYGLLKQYKYCPDCGAKMESEVPT